MHARTNSHEKQCLPHCSNGKISESKRMNLYSALLQALYL